MTTLYYFGFCQGYGHDLRGPHGSHLANQAMATILRDEWFKLDAGEFLPGVTRRRDDMPWEATHQRQSECRLTHRNGWTLVAFWDRSGDKRMKSNATFLCAGTLTFDEVLALARDQQPEALSRIEAEKPLYLEPQTSGA